MAADADERGVAIEGHQRQRYAEEKKISLTHNDAFALSSELSSIGDNDGFSQQKMRLNEAPTIQQLEAAATYGGLRHFRPSLPLVSFSCH
jgi:hypothetical protein